MTALAPVALELLKGKNNKEQVDLILEPLQVMINLAVLGFCPIGTKINIHENMLYLHQPTFAQGLWRWWEGDSKDDLYYLFHAIRRYYKWYKNKDNEIYNYILELAKEGMNAPLWWNFHLLGKTLWKQAGFRSIHAIALDKMAQHLAPFKLFVS